VSKLLTGTVYIFLLPVLHVILPLLHVTYQFENNVKNVIIIELIKPHTNCLFFAFLSKAAPKCRFQPRSVLSVVVGQPVGYAERRSS
jgi:hypothetical protein